jgi:alkylhydroperoxidase family enzyme
LRRPTLDEVFLALTGKPQEITMAARLDYRRTTIAANFGKYLNSAGKAALELTEQGTRIADAAGGGVTDQAWTNAAKHYDDGQLAALASLIAVINAYNRLNVILQRPGGDHQSGQWG